MGIRSGFRKVAKTMFNFRVDLWLDYKNLKGYTHYFYRQFRSLYHIQTSSGSETFDEAIHRLELTPELLELQKKRYYFLIYFYLFLSFSILCYTLWLILTANWMGVWMSSSVSLYALSFAFRYHFWAYQIQKRQLSCTFQDWLQDCAGSTISKLLKGKAA